MSEGKIPKEDNDYYRKIIDAHTKTDIFNNVVNFAHSLNVDLPKGIEQISLKPENAMDWRDMH